MKKIGSIFLANVEFSPLIAGTMKYEAHFLVSIWAKYKIPEEISSQIVERIQSGQIKTGNDLVEWASSSNAEVEWEYHDSDDQMHPYYNKFNSTIDILKKDDVGSCYVWSNRKDVSSFGAHYSQVQKEAIDHLRWCLGFLPRWN